MENDKDVKANGEDLFVRYSDKISEACERAVREALLKHKRAGNSVAVFRDGRVVLIPADEIVLN